LPTTIIDAAPTLAKVDLAQPPPRHVLGVVIAADRAATPSTMALHRALLSGVEPG
jgi:hypothetical protein